MTKSEAKLCPYVEGIGVVVKQFQIIFFNSPLWMDIRDV